MARYNDNSSLGWKIFSLFLALVLVAGVITGVVFWQKGNIVFNPVKQEQPGADEESPDDGGGMSIPDESAGTGMKLMSAKIAPEDYAEYGISPMAETAYTLTATIEPADATNKAVDWSVAFVNASSTWATGKTVTDYVTITPTNDGALTANVECKKAFGEQIKVIVTSRDSSDITAECTVDYTKRLTDVSVIMKKDGTPTENVVFSAEGHAYTWECSPVYGDGTLEDDFTYKYTLSTTSAAVEGVKELCSLPINKQAISVGWSQSELSFVTSKSNVLDLLKYTGGTGGAGGTKQKNDVLNAFLKYSGALFTLKIEATGEYSSNTFTKTFNAGISSFDVSVTDITLGQGSIIF